MSGTPLNHHHHHLVHLKIQPSVDQHGGAHVIHKWTEPPVRHAYTRVPVKVIALHLVSAYPNQASHVAATRSGGTWRRKCTSACRYCSHQDFVIRSIVQSHSETEKKDIINRWVR